MLKSLQKHATWRNIMILFLAFLVLEILFAVLLPMGGNAKMIDMAGAKNGNEIYHIIEKYDEHIRESYIFGAVTLDVAFPIVYFLLFILLLFRFCSNPRFIFLPFLQMIFDFFENASIVIMLKSWPDQLPTLASATVVFSWIKWGLAGVTIIIILVGLINKKLLKR